MHRQRTSFASGARCMGYAENMKACPYCSEEPIWRPARNCTNTRSNALKEKRRVASEPYTLADSISVQCFMFCGCSHAERFGALANSAVDLKRKRVFPSAECEDFAVTWDAHAEKLFADYTARYTDIQRTAFRARLWPVPFKAPQTQLFDRNNNEQPFRHSCEPEEIHPFAE